MREQLLWDASRGVDILELEFILQMRFGRLRLLLCRNFRGATLPGVMVVNSHKPT
jgi:hypothetical protein